MSGVSGSLYRQYQFDAVQAIIGERTPIWMVASMLNGGELDPRVMRAPRGMAPAEVARFFQRHGNKEFVLAGHVWYDRELLRRVSSVLDRAQYAPLRSESFSPFEYWAKGILVVDADMVHAVVAAVLTYGEPGKTILLNGSAVA